MKSLFKVSILSMLAVASSQAATLMFTNTGLGRVASGFGDASGNITNGLIWGVVVDKAGDGFGSWQSGFTYTAGNTVGITLKTTDGINTDDLLFVNGTVTSSLSTATDSAALGSGRVNSISTVTFGSQLSGGEKFAIIWFDRGIALGTTSTATHKFGLIQAGTVPAGAVFNLPAANGSTSDYSASFAGGDPVKLANLTFIPETSTALLGALGAIGLLRRRR